MQHQIQKLVIWKAGMHCIGMLVVAILASDKICFDSLRSSSCSSNWVERLHDVAEAINNQPKEVLAYQTLFQCYFGEGWKYLCGCYSQENWNSIGKMSKTYCNPERTVVQFTKEGTEFFCNTHLDVALFPINEAKILTNISKYLKIETTRYW